eukprot:6250710-Prymnesium_polylepis.1
MSARLPSFRCRVWACSPAGDLGLSGASFAMLSVSDCAGAVPGCNATSSAVRARMMQERAARRVCTDRRRHD